MGAKMGEPIPKPKQPLGYSKLPYDLGSAPIHFVEKQYNLVWSREHKDVGSFSRRCFEKLITRAVISHFWSFRKSIGRGWRISSRLFGSEESYNRSLKLFLCRPHDEMDHAMSLHHEMATQSTSPRRNYG
jgi:hypothetical protein